jgi:hypothetical protein
MGASAPKTLVKTFGSCHAVSIGAPAGARGNLWVSGDSDWDKLALAACSQQVRNKDVFIA